MTIVIIIVSIVVPAIVWYTVWAAERERIGRAMSQLEANLIVHSTLGVAAVLLLILLLSRFIVPEEHFKLAFTPKVAAALSLGGLATVGVVYRLVSTFQKKLRDEEYFIFVNAKFHCWVIESATVKWWFNSLGVAYMAGAILLVLYLIMRVAPAT